MAQDITPRPSRSETRDRDDVSRASSSGPAAEYPRGARAYCTPGDKITSARRTAARPRRAAMLHDHAGGRRSDARTTSAQRNQQRVTGSGSSAAPAADSADRHLGVAATTSWRGSFTEVSLASPGFRAVRMKPVVFNRCRVTGPVVRSCIGADSARLGDYARVEEYHTTIHWPDLPFRPKLESDPARRRYRCPPTRESARTSGTAIGPGQVAL